jgi:GntR family transcriptional regulator of arabinose operon
MSKNVSGTKYNKLKEFLKNQILFGNFKPGDQLPSENTLAEEFSLSRHTVRKAIALLVNEGYLYTEHGRGTFCADKNTRISNSKNIGVITSYISEYIFPGVIKGIDSILSKKGYSIVLKSTGNDISKETECLKDMLGKDIAGLIIEPTKSALFSVNIPYYEALGKRNIPYVFIHGYLEQLRDKPLIAMDDTIGMYKMAEYLFETGHKKPVGIFKADDIQGINRHKGYAKALADFHIPYNPDNVIWFHTEDKFEKPYAVIKNMVQCGYKFDSVICYNDEIAYEIVDALTKTGVKVPLDVSVTGFDDSYLAVNCPVKLTTASHPKERLGEAAAECILSIINNRPENSSGKIFTPELIVRDSCKKRS